VYAVHGTWYAGTAMRDTVPKVDIGILTFREDELAAVLERFPPEGVFDGRRLYNLSRVPLERGESYTVAIVRCLEEMGSGDGAAAVRDLVEELAPRLLLIVGSAAGSLVRSRLNLSYLDLGELAKLLARSTQAGA